MVVIGLLGAFLAGCSLTVPPQNDCTSTQECRETFGLGFTCGADGFCDSPTEHPRCTRTYPANVFEDRARYGSAFVIGAIADESLSTHVARQNSVQLAFLEAEAGIEGREVAVVFCTNAEDPSLDALSQNEASIDIARYLVEELAVPAIVGPPSSSATEAVFGVTGPAGTVVVSPSATSPALTALEPDGTDEAPGLLWRTAAPDSLQGAVIASDMNDRGVGEVAVIHEIGSYGEGLAEVFQAAFLGNTQLIPFGSSPARNAAATDAGDPLYEEVLFISSQTADAASFLLFVEALSAYDTKAIFLTDSARNSDFLADASRASALFAQIRGTAPDQPAGITHEMFIGAYSAEFGVEAGMFSFAPHAYDAASLTLLGATWASLQSSGPWSGIELARGFRRLSSGDAIRLGPVALERARAVFEMGMSVDIQGASGDLDYHPDTEETSAPIEVWTIDPGGAMFVEEYTVAVPP